jgi:hypothetical protein
MVCVTTGGNQLAITASVIPKNWFGRAYLVPVAPARRVFVPAILRRLRRDIARQQVQVTSTAPTKTGSVSDIAISFRWPATCATQIRSKKPARLFQRFWVRGLQRGEFLEPFQS